MARQARPVEIAAKRYQAKLREEGINASLKAIQKDPDFVIEYRDFRSGTKAYIQLKKELSSLGVNHLDQMQATKKIRGELGLLSDTLGLSRDERMRAWGSP
jgi:hypothetical protein